MTQCPPHDFRDREPRSLDRGGYTELTYLKGQACARPRCTKTKGPDKGILRIELRQKAPPTGEVPDWLVTELSSGVWTPKYPRSQTVLADVQALVQQGVVNADLKAHPKAGFLVVERVYAPQAASEDAITRLRSKLEAIVPSAADWLRRATYRDLLLAERITAVPGFRGFAWPSRVWNAAFREHSKQGDAARVAQAIGCTVSNRASKHGAWFYGSGVIKTATRSIEVDGELVVPEAWLRGPLTFQGIAECGIIENRDLASIIPGFSLALDGHLSPVQRHIISELARNQVPAWVWTDVDGAGITITRQVRQAYPKVRVLGMQSWPKEWALELTPEQALQARDAVQVADDFQGLARYVLNTGWFEQERVYAQLVMTGKDPVAFLRGTADLISP